MNKIFGIVLICVSTLFTALSQLLLKMGLNRMDIQGFGLSKLFYLLAKMAQDIYIISWFIFALLAMVLWMWGLVYLDLSLAYPFLSLGYVLIVILSAVFLNEQITLMRWSAVIVIILGIFLLYKT